MAKGERIEAFFFFFFRKGASLEIRGQSEMKLGSMINSLQFECGFSEVWCGGVLCGIAAQQGLGAQEERVKAALR